MIEEEFLQDLLFSLQQSLSVSPTFIPVSVWRGMSETPDAVEYSAQGIVQQFCPQKGKTVVLESIIDL